MKYITKLLVPMMLIFCLMIPSYTAAKSTSKSSKPVVMAIIKETLTSKLGHKRNTNVKIYKSLSNSSSAFTAGSTYSNAVYYIKKQGIVNGQTYYLLSKQPSSKKGVVGWVKSKDLSSYSHVGLDSQTKIFTFKGTGIAYSKAWGGKKDIIFGNLSAYKDQEFKINKTEKVGNNIWYRGELAGKTVWTHANHVATKQERSTSRLGQIQNSSVTIYKTISDQASSFPAGATYTNAVYYIKKQVIVNGKTYYLLSKQPSSEKGVVGWGKSAEVSTHAHVGIDSKTKTFAIKGIGIAYSKAWGGKKDIIYGNLSAYKDQEFKVQKTEKVGNNIWYRGELAGKIVWTHSSHVSVKVENATSRLGHIRNGSVTIYKKIGDNTSSFQSDSTYSNAVYYIKKQVVVNGQTYYLLSKQPSSEKGVVGWVKSADLSTYPHFGADSKTKTFSIKGTGIGYSKAWGGKKDIIYGNLSVYKDQEFQVHKTEKVGNNIWYRGELAGKILWTHSSYVSVKVENATSRLGQIRSGSVTIYNVINHPVCR
jgi:mannosyl-glycoprotein endo-beta-N-acetylglucosaminidase